MISNQCHDWMSTFNNVNISWPEELRDNPFSTTLLRGHCILLTKSRTLPRRWVLLSTSKIKRYFYVGKCKGLLLLITFKNKKTRVDFTKKTSERACWNLILWLNKISMNLYQKDCFQLLKIILIFKIKFVQMLLSFWIWGTTHTEKK